MSVEGTAYERRTLCLYAFPLCLTYLFIRLLLLLLLFRFPIPPRSGASFFGSFLPRAPLSCSSSPCRCPFPRNRGTKCTVIYTPLFETLPPRSRAQNPSRQTSPAFATALDFTFTVAALPSPRSARIPQRSRHLSSRRPNVRLRRRVSTKEEGGKRTAGEGGERAGEGREGEASRCGGWVR